MPLKVAVDSVIGHRQLPAFLAVALPDEVQRSSGLLLVTVALLQVAVLLLVHAQEAVAEVVSTSISCPALCGRWGFSSRATAPFGLLR